MGIGHAGTLISAVLLLFRQNWRNSINRSAEAMTIFAVICAIHILLLTWARLVGILVFPLPNQFGSLWINFNSPLVWDVFAISTYFLAYRLCFGIQVYCLILRPFVTGPSRMRGTNLFYLLFSDGWGLAKTWQRFEAVSLSACRLIYSTGTFCALPLYRWTLPLR